MNTQIHSGARQFPCTVGLLRSCLVGGDWGSELLGTGVLAYNSRIQEAEAEGPHFQGQPELDTLSQKSRQETKQNHNKMPLFNAYVSYYKATQF